IEQEGDQKDQKYIDQGLCTDHLLQTGGLQGAGGKAVVVPEEIQGVVQFERGKGDDKYGGHSQQRDQPVFEGLTIVAVDDHQDQQEQDQGPIVKEAGNADQDGGVKDLVFYPAYGLYGQEPPKGQHNKEVGQDGIFMGEVLGKGHGQQYKEEGGIGIGLCDFLGTDGQIDDEDGQEEDSETKEFQGELSLDPVFSRGQKDGTEIHQEEQDGKDHMGYGLCFAEKT